MAVMNPNLILQAGQTADIIGSMGRGNALAAQTNELQRQNALARTYEEFGPGLVSGDETAINRLAALDPMAALNMRTTLGNSNRADRQVSLQEQQVAQNAAHQDRTWQLSLEEHRQKVGAAQAAAEGEQVTRLVAGAKTFYDRNDPVGYQDFLTRNGLDPADYPFEQFPAIAAQYGDAAKILSGGGKTGLNPIYGRDADGNTVVLQLTDQGSAVQTAMPDGVQPDLSVRAFEQASGAAQGKAEGEARAALPANYASAMAAIDLVQDLIDDPYLSEMVGPIAGRMPNVTADAARVQSKMDQVSGEAFLQARQFLKGQGPITDYESKRAEAAMIRMNTSQSYEDYVDALREFQDAVRVGVMKAQAAAGGTEVQQPGGTGTDDSGWQTVNGIRIRRKQ